MSWTLEIETARWFAQRRLWCGAPTAGVFEATVPPAAVLAVLAGIDGMRPEAEVVVNPRRLRGRWTPRLVETLEIKDEREETD